LAVLSSTSRKSGHLQTKDQAKFVKVESNFSPNIVGYMSKKQISAQCLALVMLSLALVMLSLTSKKSGYLHPEDQAKFVEVKS
jgi:hypothetical protein